MGRITRQRYVGIILWRDFVQWRLVKLGYFECDEFAGHIQCRDLVHGRRFVKLDYVESDAFGINILRCDLIQWRFVKLEYEECDNFVTYILRYDLVHGR